MFIRTLEWLWFFFVDLCDLCAPAYHRFAHLFPFSGESESKNNFIFSELQDVTSRGIDVPMVDLVVQYSPPHQIADYVHRVGRTARAGRTGSAVLFLAPNETDFIRTLEEKRIR